MASSSVLDLSTTSSFFRVAENTNDDADLVHVDLDDDDDDNVSAY